MTNEERKKYIEEIDFTVPVTEYLHSNLNVGIKNILDILDVVQMSDQDKKALRKAILSNFNEYYHLICRVLTKVQECS